MVAHFIEGADNPITTGPVAKAAATLRLRPGRAGRPWIARGLTRQDARRRRRHGAAAHPPRSRRCSSLCGLALLGYGALPYGVLGKHRAASWRPRRRPRAPSPRTTSAAPPPARTPARGPAQPRPRLDGGHAPQPADPVAIVLWGGYAGGIMANGGFAPNKDSVFCKDFGVQVELLQIDDFEKSRDAFRAGGDKGGVDIMWSTVDAYALEYGGLSQARTPRPSCSTTGAAAATPSRWTPRSRAWPTCGQEAGLRGGDALALLRALRAHPGRAHQPRRELGLHRLGGGGGQRVQGGQGGRGRVLVARRLRGGPRAAGRRTSWPPPRRPAT